MTVSALGPDLALVGAARSGTSALAAQLAVHPQIDSGKVKEPNYFSRHPDRGDAWYDGLYQARRDGLLRFDASTSYASSLHPDALSRLVASAPDVFVIYAVRQPTQRALSHFFLRRHLLRIEESPDFGTALRRTSQYADTSDYSLWLPELRSTFGAAKLLVVPFEVITDDPREATLEICRQLGLPAPPPAEEAAVRHRNDVVQYRNSALHAVARQLSQSAVYPWLRDFIGGGRARTVLRNLLTRPAPVPDTAEAMASCAPEQLEQLKQLDARAGSAVLTHLGDQDERLSLDWASRCFAAST